MSHASPSPPAPSRGGANGRSRVTMGRQAVIGFTKARARLATVLVGIALALLSRDVWAHIDPPTCNRVGFTILFRPFRADKRTPIELDDTVTECETVCFQGVLSRTSSNRDCAFENGLLRIRLPNGDVKDVTPPRGIPCIGGTVDDTTLPRPMGDCGNGLTSFVSDFACYAVRRQDVVNGVIPLRIEYSGGLGHVSANNVPGLVNGGTDFQLGVHFCAGAVTDCTAEICDPNRQEFPDANSYELGTCVVRDLVDGMPCPDTDGNASTFAACRAGAC